MNCSNIFLATDVWLNFSPLTFECAFIMCLFSDQSCWSFVTCLQSSLHRVNIFDQFYNSAIEQLYMITFLCQNGKPRMIITRLNPQRVGSRVCFFSFLCQTHAVYILYTSWFNHSKLSSNWPCLCLPYTIHWFGSHTLRIRFARYRIVKYLKLLIR